MSSEKPLQPRINVDFLLAEPSNLPQLAEINTLAYKDEQINRFAFRDWPNEANLRDFYHALIEQRQADPATRIFKAVDSSTREIVGFLCWTLEGGKDGKSNAESNDDSFAMVKSTMKKMGNYLDKEFMHATGPEYQKLKDIMQDSKHYCQFPPSTLYPDITSYQNIQISPPLPYRQNTKPKASVNAY
jgi:hypothetical protein